MCSVSGLSPFAGNCDVETMGNVTVGKYDFNDEAFDNVSSDCIDFITKLLVKEHDKRLTAKEAIRHKWVKRKPQYHPTTTKPSTSPLSFKSGYTDKVRSFSSWFTPAPSQLHLQLKRAFIVDDVGRRVNSGFATFLNHNSNELSF